MKEFFLNAVFFLFVFLLLILVFTILKAVLAEDEYNSPAVQINTTPCEIPLEWGKHYIAINDSTFVIYSPTDTVICTQK